MRVKARIPAAVETFENNLEGNAKTQFDPPAALRAVGGNQLRIDHAKRRRIKTVKRRVKEIHVVENVKEIGGNLDLEALVERGHFSEARVQIPQPEAAHRIPGAVPRVRGQKWVTEVGRRRIRIGENVDVAGGAKSLAGHPEICSPAERARVRQGY